MNSLPEKIGISQKWGNNPHMLRIFLGGEDFLGYIASLEKNEVISLQKSWEMMDLFY